MKRIYQVVDGHPNWIEYFGDPLIESGVDIAQVQDVPDDLWDAYLAASRELLRAEEALGYFITETYGWNCLRHNDVSARR